MWQGSVLSDYEITVFKLQHPFYQGGVINPTLKPRRKTTIVYLKYPQPHSIFRGHLLQPLNGYA
jgi:hypothetical protein